MKLRLVWLSACLPFLVDIAQAQQPPAPASGIEAVKAKLLPCWNSPGGRQFVIDVRVEMQPDGTPRIAEIVDKARYDSDPSFKSAALAARRAVMNPSCQPWPLDPAHYEEWKVITIRFDPQHF